MYAYIYNIYIYIMYINTHKIMRYLSSMKLWEPLRFERNS